MNLFDEIKKGSKIALSKAITLIESSNTDDQVNARKLILKCKNEKFNSIRIGVTGIPGVGKSTFIDSFGKYLTSKKHKVAVLAIDPSSEKTKGSILGDKSRMEKLSADQNSFIRPTPSSGFLGGVAKKTRETITLCEAAGYDIIIIETVGVGQSEISINNLVDFTLLLMISGAGDELQGIKRGIIEFADAIIINKADGENKSKAINTSIQYKNTVGLLNINREKPIHVGYCSSINNEGIQSIWKLINNNIIKIQSNNIFNQTRKKQEIFWLHKRIKDDLGLRKYEKLAKSKKIEKLEHELNTNSDTLDNIINKL